MKRIVISIIVLFLLINVSLIEGKERKIDKLKFPALSKIKKPVIEKAVTKNGINIRLIKSDKFPIVTFMAMIKGGDVYDPESKVGLASITAQLLRIGGTKTLSGEKVDLKLDSKGISISIRSGLDDFTINVSSLKDNFDEAMSILADMLLNPAFNKDKFKEIKSKMSSLISRRNDDPSSINSREFDKLIYGKNSPFSVSLEYDHLENIKLKDVSSCYSTFFKPDSMLVGVTGPMKIKEIKKIIEKYLGKWSGKAILPKYPEVKELKHNFKIGFVEKSNMNQSQISIGHLGVKENIDEKAKILVFNSIFSQGFSSRLMQRLRVKMGLTYGVGGGIITNYLYPGRVLFSTFTKSETTIEVIKAIFDEIDLIKKGKVTAKELKEAKDYFLNSYVFKFSSPDKVLYNYLEKEFFGLDIEKYEKLIDDIKLVTADDVYEVANKYLDPKKMVVLVVGNKKKIKGNLSDIGKVENIDISIKQPKLKEVIPEATPESLKKGRELLFSVLNKNYSGYKSIKTSIQKSDMDMSMMGRTMAISQTSYAVYPDKFYSEMKVMGMVMKRAINGKKGYADQMGQKKEIPEKDIEESKFADLYDIFHSKNKYSYQYLKKVVVKGKTYDVIYIKDKGKNWVKFFLNRDTGLIEIKEKLVNIARQKGVGKIYMSKFKKQNAISFPFKTEIFLNGKRLINISVKEVVVNAPVDKSLFKLD